MLCKSNPVTVNQEEVLYASMSYTAIRSSIGSSFLFLMLLHKKCITFSFAAFCRRFFFTKVVDSIQSAQFRVQQWQSSAGGT